MGSPPCPGQAEDAGHRGPGGQGRWTLGGGVPGALTSLGDPSEACAESSTVWKDGGVEVLTGTHMLQDMELRVFRGRFPQTHLRYSDLFLSLKATAQEEGH